MSMTYDLPSPTDHPLPEIKSAFLSCDLENALKIALLHNSERSSSCNAFSTSQE